MRLVKRLIVQASLIAVLLSISLSGLGMAHAHEAIPLDGLTMDASAHAAVDHTGHDMDAADQGQAHDGHANCAMIACCHTGGTASPSVPSMTGAITCQKTLFPDLPLTSAETEAAKKPPKHS
ncbi:hypothetical protein [Roseovarius faecimaris]|nr:hypothetical protein [Roseovarius faecimaris]